jgi:hypothetical protein
VHHSTNFFLTCFVQFSFHHFLFLAEIALDFALASAFELAPHA